MIKRPFLPQKSPLNILIALLLRLFAGKYNSQPQLNRLMKGEDGWLNFTLGIKTENGSVVQSVRFHNGRVSVAGSIPDTTDVTITFVNNRMLFEALRITPNELLGLILKNRMILTGNIGYLQLFNYLVSVLMGDHHRRMLNRVAQKDKTARLKRYGLVRHYNPEPPPSPSRQSAGRSPSKNPDLGVRFLEDPALSAYTLDDFPRLQSFLDIHFNETPEVCDERPHLLTEWYRKHGFETDENGKPWDPVLRQGLALRYLLENKKPIIRKNDLIAGTTTAKETTGVVIYPDAQGLLLWGELNSIGDRLLNPYILSDETRTNLHTSIFPFWVNRNFKEWARQEFGYPLSQKIEERWVSYFVWKSVGISHTIPDFESILKHGTSWILKDIRTKLSGNGTLTGPEQRTLQAMAHCLEGVSDYATRLSQEAQRLSEVETDDKRKSELETLKTICSRVPTYPAETLDEAVNAIWITWVALHMENTNTGLSLGRLDQLLQPYLERDLEALTPGRERERYIRHAIELIGCFFMRGTDHLPLVPDIGNYLFGGSSSDQAITIGGITPEGDDAVCDMSYIVLKVTEMLSIRDPNVNARFHPEKNSDTWLRRMCDVNRITGATPSMHNDNSVIESLKKHGYPIEDIRDWSSTGCVEPTLSGKHMGHTGAILMNLVAGLEMALNNGTHPLMNWSIGPITGEPETFSDFDHFFEAYTRQQQFLIDQAVDLNNKLAEIHANYRPTPLISSLMRGAVETATDVTKGGAAYNTSGTSNIGLADVTDSLMAIKTLVFDLKLVSFPELANAIRTNFHDHPELAALIRSRVPLFGSGSMDAVDMANRITATISSLYASHTNYRGGPYTTGFWSMSQHVAYGNLSGTLPSGRISGKPFTPGLTPSPNASDNFLDNLRDVANLDCRNMDNNIAFNVKLIPGPDTGCDRMIDTMVSYVKTYFSMGGMQMQFNVVTAETLKDAMAYPEKYKNLLVRISGYNAYFVTLNKEMQNELIERTEYRIH